MSVSEAFVSTSFFSAWRLLGRSLWRDALAHFLPHHQRLALSVTFVLETGCYAFFLSQGVVPHRFSSSMTSTSNKLWKKVGVLAVLAFWAAALPLTLAQDPLYQGGGGSDSIIGISHQRSSSSSSTLGRRRLWHDARRRRRHHLHSNDRRRRHHQSSQWGEAILTSTTTGAPWRPPSSSPTRPPMILQRDYSSHFLDFDEARQDKRTRYWRVNLKSRRPGRLNLTSRIVWANIFMYALQVWRPGITEWGLKRSDLILQGRELYRLFSPVWLHANPGHLFTNMFSLSAYHLSWPS